MGQIDSIKVYALVEAAASSTYVLSAQGFVFYANNRYSVRQKQCSKVSNEKSLVFLTVNLFKILHASSYGI